MRKMTQNQIANYWNAPLEIVEIELVARIPSKMSRSLRCTVVEVSQDLFCGGIERREGNKLTAYVRNFHLIREAVLDAVLTPLNKFQSSLAINTKTEKLQE